LSATVYVPCNSSWNLHSHWQIQQQHTSNIHPGNGTIHHHASIDMHPFPITDAATTRNMYSSPTTTQPQAMTAATHQQHMHQQLHLILLSFSPHLVTPTSPYWCSTFLICYYAWHGLPKSHAMPDVAFYLHGWSFLHILLTYLFPYFIPTLMQRRYSNFLFLILIVAYRSYSHAMKIICSCLSRPP
jgi:hypothetical protein